VSFWYGNRVFITGVSGLIGAPLAKILLKEGAEVTGFDLNTKGCLVPYGIHDEFYVQEASVLDKNLVASAMQDHDVVIHLAAQSGVEAARTAGYDAWDLNVMGTLNVLEAMRRHKPGAGLFASSNHVYGLQDTDAPTDEQAPMRQLDTYSGTKIASDYMARSYAHNYGVAATVIRNTNCYGPNDPHSNHLIPGTILSVFDGTRPVIRGRGTTEKGYLYVDDVAEAYMKLAQWTMETGQRGEAFNVSGPSVTVMGIVNSILSVMESRLPAHVQGKPDDQANENLDCSKMTRETGWFPRHDLTQGLEKTVAGFRERVSV
jgi:CDP-glucose 4,6-dehydratase